MHRRNVLLSPPRRPARRRGLLPAALAALVAALAPATATAQTHAGTVTIRSTPPVQSAPGVSPIVRYYSTADTITVRIAPTGGGRILGVEYQGSGDDTSFSLNIGGTTRTVSKIVTGLPLDYVEFDYIVQADDWDGNGVSVDANAFGGSVFLKTGTNILKFRDSE